MSLSHLLDQKDIKIMNHSVFEWLDGNPVEPDDFLAYLERVNNEADHNGQCGAAIDYICEKLIKQGRLGDVVELFFSVNSIPIAPIMRSIVINSNRSVEQFFNAMLDHEQYGFSLLNAISFKASLVEKLWHSKFINNPNIQRAIKYNGNLAAVLLSCWNADTDKKLLISLAQQGCIAPSLFLPQLKFNPTLCEELLPHWIQLFPQYIQNNVHEIVQHLTPEAFENFFDRIVVQSNPKIVALCLHKLGSDFHKTTQHICEHIQWNSETFEQLYDVAVCQHWQPYYFNESLFSHFVKFWLNNAPEHAQHLIDEYIRCTGEEFDDTTQALIERMRIGHSVDSAGLDIFKRKM